jgi:hypothetical protein
MLRLFEYSVHELLHSLLSLDKLVSILIVPMFLGCLAGFLGKHLDPSASALLLSVSTELISV